MISIDTCWAVSIGLGTVDTIRGMAFAKRHMYLALEAGEPYRVARALALEAAFSATGGTDARARTAELIEESMTLAEQVNHPHALGLANITAGMAAYLEGRWNKACERLERGEKILREHCYRGHLGAGYSDVVSASGVAVHRRLQEHPRAAAAFSQRRARKGRSLRRGQPPLPRGLGLATGCRPPRGGRQEIDDAISRWSQHGFHIQHYWHLTGKVEIELYRGDAVRAWKLLERAWPVMSKSMLLRIQLTAAEAGILRGRTALAAAIAHRCRYRHRSPPPGRS